jgi:2-amino-4-hydroxy-6-hydroxymethyldihydropteridine diphosphokinase
MAANPWMCGQTPRQIRNKVRGVNSSDASPDAAHGDAIVYIGLGSNLDDPPRQIRRAVRALRQLPRTAYLGDSGLFLSRPLLPPDAQQRDIVIQPDYCNAVARLRTALEPLELLDRLQQIENEQGRVRGERWGARCIDLDILLYGDLCIEHERLQVPHPGLHLREFVLFPLHRLAPSLQIPGHGKLDALLRQCPRNGIEYLGMIEEPRV